MVLIWLFWIDPIFAYFDSCKNLELAKKEIESKKEGEVLRFLGLSIEDSFSFLEMNRENQLCLIDAMSLLTRKGLDSNNNKNYREFFTPKVIEKFRYVADVTRAFSLFECLYIILKRILKSECNSELYELLWNIVHERGTQNKEVHLNEMERATSLQKAQNFMGWANLISTCLGLKKNALEAKYYFEKSVDTYSTSSIDSNIDLAIGSYIAIGSIYLFGFIPSYKKDEYAKYFFLKAVSMKFPKNVGTPQSSVKIKFWWQNEAIQLMKNSVIFANIQTTNWEADMKIRTALRNLNL